MSKCSPEFEEAYYAALTWLLLCFGIGPLVVMGAGFGFFYAVEHLCRWLLVDPAGGDGVDGWFIVE